MQFLSVKYIMELVENGAATLLINYEGKLKVKLNKLDLKQFGYPNLFQNEIKVKGLVCNARNMKPKRFY